MNYDPIRNVYIDTETGDIIPISEDDDLNGTNFNLHSSSGYTQVGAAPMEPAYGSMTHTGDVELGSVDYDSKITDGFDADRQFAVALQREEMEQQDRDRVVGTASRPVNYNQDIRFGGAIAGPVSSLRQAAPATTTYSVSNTNKPETESKLFKELASMSKSLTKKKNKNKAPIPELNPATSPENELLAQDGINMEDSTTDDWTIARAMQMAEFEIDNEMYQLQGGDFVDKEVRGSSCWRQMKTISTLLCVLQILVLVFTIEDDGMAPLNVNSMYGPYPTTLVRWGAKDAALIHYRGEWWRLFSPIMLHAGIIHLVSNVFIQLRVGGYLNLVFGNKAWLLIYILSGVYGNMLSCVMLTDSIGVGSSGALLGIVAAWIVWIIFRWNKIPENNRSQRNCQLLMVTGAVVATLTMSFSDLVDYAAHFGGAIQGVLWGVIVLSKELDNENTQKWARFVAGVLSLGLFAVTLFYMLTKMEPSDQFFPLLDANDDWNKYPHNGPVDVYV